MLTRLGLASLVMVLFSLLVAGTAAATQRFASPTPTASYGSGCDDVLDPCSLSDAGSWANSNPGDEVVLAGGDYNVGNSTMMVTGAIDVHGPVSGTPARFISTGGPAFQMDNAGAVVRDLEIVQTSGTLAAIMILNGTVERITARSEAGSGCLLRSATIKSSICVSGAAGLAGIYFNESSGAHSVTLRNVTSIGTGSANGLTAVTSGTATANFDIKTSIVRGNSVDIAAANAVDGATVITAAHTNYSSNAGNASTVTPPSAPTMQSSPPIFVDAPGGNYHQEPISPTVNAGSVDEQSSATDFEGDARTVGSAPDIGADEVHMPTITFPANGSFISDNTPTVEGTTKDGAAVELLVDGATPICTTFATVGEFFCTASTLPDGPHTFSANDIFEGNNSLSTVVTATIDTIAPIVSISSTTGTATFAVVDANPGVSECRVDSAAFATCSSGVSLAAATPGTHTFEVRHTDLAGNVGSASASFTTSALKNLETVISKRPKKQTKSRKAAFKFTSSAPGSRFMCKLDRGKFKPCKSKHSVKVKPGRHTLQVYAIDRTGTRDPSPATCRWKVLKR